MKRPVVVTLGTIAAIVVLGVILAVLAFGYVYYTGNLDHNPERAKGEEFGPSTDQQGCVDESLRRIGEYPHSTIFEKIETVYIPSFTSGCFSTCKPSKDFCDPVPRMKDIFDSQLYIQRKCEHVDGPCDNVFRRVIKECKRQRQTVASHPDD
jgi:hypothetical protein